MFWSALNAAWSVFEASKTLDGSKLLSVCICFVNFYDVVDGSMLRCTGSGIGSASLFVRNVLTSDGS